MKSLGSNLCLESKITIWFMIQSLLMILASALSFLFVEIAAVVVFRVDLSTTFIWHAFGTVLPLCTLLGALNYFLSKYTFKKISVIIDGIKKIADGDFNVTLEENENDIFTDVYKNFNKMRFELKNTQMLKNDFINNYSHEFKTPITSINGFAELLLDTEVSAQEQKQYLQIIADESARLARLATSTIFLSKLETQNIITDKCPYSLDEQLKECAIILSPQWQEKNIVLSADLCEVTYLGNKQLMQHIWLNLINNAIKYTPTGGQITIIMKQEVQSIAITITDSGVGMSEETLTYVFNKYYQANASATPSGGLGLGLAIVKRIVDLCNGSIEVKSELNKGSSFIVHLPLK